MSSVTPATIGTHRLVLQKEFYTGITIEIIYPTHDNVDVNRLLGENFGGKFGDNHNGISSGRCLGVALLISLAANNCEVCPQTAQDLITTFLGSGHTLPTESQQSEFRNWIECAYHVKLVIV